MTRSAANTFNANAQPAKHAPKRRRPFSVSIRVSDAERDALKRKAGKRSIGAYVREKTLGDDLEQRRKNAAKPSIDYALLGQLLGKLGKSDQVSCLFLLAVAAEAERLALSDGERASLQAACQDVREMRGMLIEALGLRGKRE